jgi:hypothetical protein
MVKVSGDNGQIMTIEAITAAVILLSVLALVVQATSVTPMTTSFTNNHIKLELQNMGTDILASQDETPYSSVYTTNPNIPSCLKKSITDWINATNGEERYAWGNESIKYVPLFNPLSSSIDTPLTNTLSLLIRKYGISYNTEVRYSDINGTVMDTKMIWNGNPSENSVTVSRLVVLHEQDLLNPNNCFIRDISPDTNLHNTVEVRLTMWVM